MNQPIGRRLPELNRDCPSPSLSLTGACHGFLVTAALRRSPSSTASWPVFVNQPLSNNFSRSMQEHGWGEGFVSDEACEKGAVEGKTVIRASRVGHCLVQDTSVRISRFFAAERGLAAIRSRMVPKYPPIRSTLVGSLLEQCSLHLSVSPV